MDSLLPSQQDQQIAERTGLDYDAPQFPSVVLDDGDGASHTFLIRLILVPTGDELEAVEKTGDDRPGYGFAVLGDFEADPWACFSGSRAHAGRGCGGRNGSARFAATTPSRM